MFRGRIRSIHFVGIGGIGMSGIAEVLLAHGFEVSGSDLGEGDNTRRLASLGARIFVGHAAENARNAFTTDAPQAQGAWGDPNQIFRHGYYDLADDEALVIEFTPPDCFYWNFQLDNRWMESLDYTRHTISLNHTQIQTDEDGYFEVVLSHRDLGQKNRLDPAGHHAGFLLARNLLLEGDAPMFEIQVQYEHEYLHG